jgi:hypothetical protein
VQSFELKIFEKPTSNHAASAGSWGDPSSDPTMLAQVGNTTKYGMI